MQNVAAVRDDMDIAEALVLCFCCVHRHLIHMCWRDHYSHEFIPAQESNIRHLIARHGHRLHMCLFRHQSTITHHRFRIHTCIYQHQSIDITPQIPDTHMRSSASIDQYHATDSGNNCASVGINPIGHPALVKGSGDVEIQVLTSHHYGFRFQRFYTKGGP